MGQDKIPMTKKRIKFLKTYADLDDSEILRELLFLNQLQLDKLEKIRSNSSMLVWWLVAIPVIMVIVVLIFGGFGALL